MTTTISNPERQPIQTIIHRVDSLLRAHRPAYYARLERAARARELRAFQSALGSGLKDNASVSEPAVLDGGWGEHQALYSWKNGQRGFAALHHNLTFMRLGQAREAHEILTGLLRKGDFTHANWWHPGWIPFLDNGAGDHYCVDTAGVFTGHAGQIIEFRHDNPGRNIVAPNLAAWLSDVASMLDETDWSDPEAESYLEWTPRTPGYPIVMKAG